MKLTTAIAISVLLLLTAPAFAGDYHTGTALKCYQCHLMHDSASHTYTDDGGYDFGTGSSPASSYMLRFPDVTTLCLSCHDGEDTIDVYGDAAQGAQPALRSAGRFNNDATDAYAPFSSTFGHNLKNGSETPPGGSGSYDLDCASCHDPHGNDYYRNLRDFGTGGITYAKAINNLNMDVFELKPYPANSVSEAYDTASISYNRSQTTGHRLEKFCVHCHAGIHSAGKVDGDWLKHPTVGYGKSYTAGTASPLKTLGGRPVAGDAGNLIAGHVTCVTCHKAHGSTHPFGLIYDNRTTAALEDGDGQSFQQTCQHCHNKGLVASG